jgi:hypothetical protein
MSKTLKEKIAVMQHYDNGGKVEVQSVCGQVWDSGCLLGWNWVKYDYRIKSDSAVAESQPSNDKQHTLEALKVYASCYVKACNDYDSAYFLNRIQNLVCKL